MKTFYITTAIAYVNAPPHLGFALELIQTDAMARYKRLMGYDTWFLTGTDEHGLKIYNTAQKAGEDTKQFVDRHAEIFRGLKKTLNLSNDDFIQTSDQQRHWPACQKMWKKLVEKDDIYQKEYEGLYCEGCELFMKETDLVDGLCPHHKKAPVLSKETNYFFRLSKYSKKIGELIESDTLKVQPETRKHEFLNMVKEGLLDVSFSRPKEVLPWGVPVPDDPSHVMYVWCDALTNYISAIGFNDETDQFKKYWPADYHVIGKDIVRFHAGIWIGMLLSAEIPLPKAIFAHGFLSHNGQKMSKTLGNVVDPIKLVNEYGADPLRYYLLSEIPTGKDGDFNDELFVERYNSELANNLGNLVNRLHTLISRNDIDVFDFSRNNDACKNEVESTWLAYQKAMDEFNLHEGAEIAWKLINFANKHLEEEQPWKAIKEDREGGLATLCNLLELLRHVTLMIHPFIPEASEKIRNQIGLEPQVISSESKEWGSVDWNSLGEQAILFPRIEE